MLRGRGFESRCHMLYGRHFFTLICCNNCIDVCLNRPKINEKEAHFLEKNVFKYFAAEM